MLHLAKGRAPLVYTWPLPAVTAGTTFVHEVSLWDAAGAPMVLDGYGFSARITDRFSDRVVATGAVSIPATGKVRCTFAAGALTQEETEVYRFTLDAVGSSGVQRLVDSRLQVQGGGVGIGISIDSDTGEIVVPDPPDVPDPPPVVIPRRTISLVSPTTVFSNVPTVITLVGTNFAATDKIRIGSSATPITPTTVTATQITFTLPGTFAAGAQSIYVAPAPNYLTTDPATSLPATVTLTAAPASPYPNASNTGPTGTLIDRSGDINVNQASTVIENLRLTGGYINVAGYDNCIIRNCEINATGAFFGIDADSAGNILIENCRVIGTGGQGGILVNDGTVRGCDVSGMQNGILFAGGPNLIENNYIHDLKAWDAASAHFDGMQTGGCANTVIRHNTIISFDTSNVFLKNDFGAITNVKVLDNQFLNDPRGPTSSNVYVDGRGTQTLVSNVEVAFNFGEAGYAGQVYVSTENTVDINVHDNDLGGVFGIASMTPVSALVGGVPFTLTVTGSKFTGASVIWFNGVAQVTSFVSSTSLRCTIDPAGATAGNKTVYVRDGANQTGSLSFQYLAAGTTVFSFYNGAAPGGNAANDDIELTIGARIDPLVAGKITAVKWYRAHANAAADGKVAIWEDGGSGIVETTFTGKSGVGWQSVPIVLPGPMSTIIPYLVGVWIKLGSDGKAWYQAEGHKFQTSGLTITGIATMPPSDGVVARGVAQKNNKYSYGTGDIARPDSEFEGACYYVDVDFEPS